jgi:hypothetical protein
MCGGWSGTVARSEDIAELALDGGTSNPVQLPRMDQARISSNLSRDGRSRTSQQPLPTPQLTLCGQALPDSVPCTLESGAMPDPSQGQATQK